MGRQVVRRFVVGFGIVLFVLTLTFILLNLAPGDPARLWVAPDADQATLDAARQDLGLDRPVAIRYVSWLGAFAKGGLKPPIWSSVTKSSAPATTAGAMVSSSR